MENVSANNKPVEAKAPEARAPRPAGGRKPFNKDGRKPRKNSGPRRPRRDDDLEEKVVAINRVSKTTKGGRTMRFTALVVVGDKKGRVGYGTGKAGEVPTAIKKAIMDAKRNVNKVAIVKNGTIPHEAIGIAGSGKVFMKQAPAGTGVIAGAAARAVFEHAGITNIYSKVQGSRTPLNVVRATIQGLNSLKTKEQVEEIRGVKL